MALRRYPLVDDSGPEWNHKTSYVNGAAQPAGTVMVDTGQLPAGWYEVVCSVEHNEASTTIWNELQYRDAANAANNELWPVGNAVSTGLFETKVRKIQVAADERFRIVQVFTANAGKYYYFSLAWRQVNEVPTV